MITNQRRIVEGYKYIQIEPNNNIQVDFVVTIISKGNYDITISHEEDHIWELIKENENEVVKLVSKEIDTLLDNERVPVINVSRNDFIGKGYDVANIPRDKFETLALKMQAPLMEDYWGILEDVAEEEGLIKDPELVEDDV